MQKINANSAVKVLDLAALVPLFEDMHTAVWPAEMEVYPPAFVEISI